MPCFLPRSLRVRLRSLAQYQRITGFAVIKTWAIALLICIHYCTVFRDKLFIPKAVGTVSGTASQTRKASGLP